MATIKQIRDDATAAIAALAAVTSRSITPRAMWVPMREADDALPDVIVAPVSREVELVGRGTRGDTFTIQVGIFEALASDADAAATAGHVLADAIIEGLLSQRMTGASGAICFRARQVVINAPEQWRRLHQFVGVVELSFRS